jgi:hypothetical protein
MMPGGGGNRVRSRTTVLAIVLALGLLSACGTHSGPVVVNQDVASGQPTNADLQRILDRRAQALLAANEQGYLGDLDQSNHALVGHERMVYANLRQFQLADVRFVTDQVIAPPPQSGQTVSKFAPVIEVVQLAGDAGPPKVAPGESFEYDLARKDGRLVVTGLVPLTPNTVQQRQLSTGVYGDAPWDLTPLKVVNVGDVWLAADHSVPNLSRYADAAKAQLSAVESLWGQRPRFPGYVLFLSSDVNDLHTWYSAGASVDRAEGLEVPQVGVRINGTVYDGQYVGARVLINLGRIGFFGDDPGRVMRHELTHAVTARITAVGRGLGTSTITPPVWALEGFARYVEVIGDPSLQQNDSAVVARFVGEGRFTGSPPSSQGFYNGDDATVNTNYDLGASIFSYVQKIKDVATAVEFYARAVPYSDLAPDEPLITAPAFDGICRSVLGISAATFLQQWAAWVRSGAR